jgi:hypothetical protein
MIDQEYEEFLEFKKFKEKKLEEIKKSESEKVGSSQIENTPLSIEENKDINDTIDFKSMEERIKTLEQDNIQKINDIKEKEKELEEYKKLLNKPIVDVKKDAQEIFTEYFKQNKINI